MTLEELKVAVTDLQVGMYVCRLDRPWEGTPFLLQGLMVESADDVAVLQRLCTHVYVDVERGLGRMPPSLQVVGPAATPSAVPAAPRNYENDQIAALQGTVAYPERVEFDQELDSARQAHAQAAAFAERALEEVRGGRAIAVEEVRDAIEPMVRSLVRNADAFLWLDALRARGAYEYRHALSCSALAAAFGRHVGLPEPLLLDMASGGLLLDVGKLRLPPALLASPAPYDDTQRSVMQTHVESGLALVDAAGVPAHVREMIRTHHEWIDGSGYPGRLQGDAIPLLGRIAAVIDAYDAMISTRPHRQAVAPHVALQSLYRGRGTQFAAEIVEQFMQCMGVYPIGALVELSTGEVAIVTAQNAARRLQPRVMVLTGPDKRLLTQFHSIDLLVRGHSDEPVRIAGALAPGAYGLDPVGLFL
ncbi:MULTISPECIES: HD-GYP domain-containing protein [Luteimonas]|uniref:Metal-dependent phosphohydrolase n=1 Tax=Luteimonas chenhongjianii TaxID=2006110 RepID=A0A290XGG0_9GAMM|nr:MULTISPECIES: HD-GYP domain-containing protein [Luteimonas]ATD68220.1 metal-dependent phosphohydrolase [Luteimonas chenhongjianii]RPD88102.1 HD-GYP domain-containing protein [Luteimonas sp. 100069]